LAAGSIWALLTFFFQTVISWAGSDFKYVLFARAIFGGAQGVHFPALASISSRNLNSKDRTFFFSATSAGAAMGTLFTGTVGSYANEAYGWPYVFYFIGKNIFIFIFFLICKVLQ
jgi:predicted MFS family arabinose efflux permease